MSAPSSQVASFEAIYARDAAGLQRVARLYGGADAEDLGQDIAVAIWMGLKTFRGQCSPRTYAYRIAHNRGISFRNRRHAEPLERDADVEAISDDCTDEVAQQAERYARLMTAVRTLSDDMQQVLTLTLEGFSYEEISGITGFSKSNVGVLLNRAKNKLGKLMEADDDPR